MHCWLTNLGYEIGLCGSWEDLETINSQIANTATLRCTDSVVFSHNNDLMATHRDAGCSFSKILQPQNMKSVMKWCDVRSINGLVTSEFVLSSNTA